MTRLKVKDIRIMKGLTQKQLAEKMGISQNFLSEIENNKVDIRLSMIEKLVLALDVLPCDLIEKQYQMCEICEIKKEP